MSIFAALYQSFSILHPISPISSASPSSYCCPPPQEIYKLNCDASFRGPDRSKEWYQIYLKRNFRSRSLSLGRHPILFTSAMHGKATAIRKGLSHAMSECFDSLQVEYDCRASVASGSSSPLFSCSRIFKTSHICRITTFLATMASKHSLDSFNLCRELLVFITHF
ncbi:hypothetical protein NE237_017513 [Protea cynaroides]|uniref:Uncharacterized protein n=1 Tax=Protea cynaroides TaxID=273540 RepID=A0A9Q0K849_9MAGN|nr:hypothetical protein NE237_017513 [Protea cynaroides]